MGSLRSVVSAVAVASLVITSNMAGAGSTLAGVSYLDSHAPIPARVKALLGRMTLAEKAGQMDQILIGNLRGDCQGANGPLVPACEQSVFVQYGTGSILAGGTDNPVNDTAEQWALDYNEAQHYAIEHTRLHIPVLFGLDAVHGFSHPVDAPLFPHQIGLGATWDPELVQAAGEATGRAIGATGWVWDFAPVQDLARDARWGRFYETWAEAPVLDGSLGAAFVKGLQNPSDPVNELGTAATVKHFAGYSQAINGHDRVEAQLPIRYLQDVILPGYEAAIAAGSKTVMVNSGSVNGVPATASRYLLTDVLRRQMGFKGVVISDYGDVRSLQTAYHLSSDYSGAIALAVNAGVDMAMEPSDPAAFTSGLIQAVQSGKISKKRIDQAVSRILTLKFELGLFDHPYVDPSRANAVLEGDRALALQASEESMTLLRNVSAALPLDHSSKVVVTGPNADSVTGQLGGWSVSWQGVFGGGQVCCASGPNQIPPTVTVLEGIRNEIGAGNVTFAQTQASAVSAMAGADAAIVVVGEGPYAEGLGDKPDPILDQDQQALIAALEATGKPVIVVVIAGRPLGLGPGYQANAILMAYQGGTETGTAVADVIFGKTNPSGHLSVSWPSASTTWASNFDPGGPSTPGDQPKTYDQLPGTNSGQGSGYNPAYPIGFGLSYTTFATSGLAVDAAPGKSGKLRVSFTVANTGQRDGATVIPVWVQQPSVGMVSVPPRQLVGFVRVDLAAGGSVVKHLSVSTDWLKVTAGDVDGSGPRILANGTYTVAVGTENQTFVVH